MIKEYKIEKLKYIDFYYFQINWIRYYCFKNMFESLITEQIRFSVTPFFQLKDGDYYLLNKSRIDIKFFTRYQLYPDCYIPLFE